MAYSDQKGGYATPTPQSTDWGSFLDFFRGNKQGPNTSTLPTIGAGPGGTGYNRDSFRSSGLGQGYALGGGNMGGNFGVQDYTTPNTGFLGGVGNALQTGKFGSLAGWGEFAQGIGSIAQYYSGKDQVKEGKRQFGIQQEFAERQYADSKAAFDQERGYLNRARARFGIT